MADGAGCGGTGDACVACAPGAGCAGTTLDVAAGFVSFDICSGNCALGDGSGFRSDSDVFGVTTTEGGFNREGIGNGRFGMNTGAFDSFVAVGLATADV